MERGVHEAGVADVVEADQSQRLAPAYCILLFVPDVRVAGGRFGWLCLCGGSVRPCVVRLAPGQVGFFPPCFLDPELRPFLLPPFLGLLLELRLLLAAAAVLVAVGILVVGALDVLDVPVDGGVSVVGLFDVGVAERALGCGNPCVSRVVVGEVGGNGVSAP